MANFRGRLKSDNIEDRRPPKKMRKLSTSKRRSDKILSLNAKGNRDYSAYGAWGMGKRPSKYKSEKRG